MASGLSSRAQVEVGKNFDEGLGCSLPRLASGLFRIHVTDCPELTGIANRTDSQATTGDGPNALDN
jgi:hypothetical protein